MNIKGRIGGSLSLYKRITVFIVAIIFLCFNAPAGIYVASAETGIFVPEEDSAITNTDNNGYTAPVTILTNGVVTITGVLPENAYLVVTEVSTADALSLLGDEKVAVLFAYDIKIMLPGDPNPTEFEPGSDNPVIVTIAQPEPIEATVEVLHITENEITGETTPETVKNIVTTQEGTVAFKAESFSVYIGTVGSGSAVTLTPERGYTFYSDPACTQAISGTQLISNARTIYAKANTNYFINAVTVKNESGSVSTATVIGTAGTEAFEIAFPNDLIENQIITVNDAVNAVGGTVSNTSTTTNVAMMFDSTAINNDSDNVTVTGDGLNFTVTLKNDITLNGMITIESDVTLTILSEGDHTISRGESCDTHLFSTTGGHLVLGSGTISNNNITYNFNDGSTVTYPVGGTIPESDVTTYVTHTELNANIESTLAGTLTIDGGALNILAPYTGTSYSYETAGNKSDNKNLIKCVNGSVTMWGGVTLQNNLFAGNDTYGGGAVNLNNGTMYMYGGTIKRCVNVCSTGDTASSLGDGGGMFLQGTSARLYMYGGTITECESDNSGAISLWLGASLYLMGGKIEKNFSVGDTQFPAQAISAYNSAKMYIFDGDINNNDGVNNIADIRISTVGSNQLHFFGGTVGRIVANDNDDNMLYVYAGNAASIIPSGLAQLIRYTGTMRAVTLPNAVQSNGAQIVRVTIYDGSLLVGAYNLRGAGTNQIPDTSLLLDLSIGTHTVEINSVSMTKTYNITVEDSSYSMTSSIIMTTPILFTKTENTITLTEAGTGNSVDGTMYYGYSTEIDSQPTNWQTSPTFTELNEVRDYYCYVKVISEEHPSGLVCETPLKVPIASIDIIENILLAPGGTCTIIPSIIPEDCPLTGITWQIANASGTDTTVRSSSGYGKVVLSTDEPSSTDITVTADLYGRTASTKLFVAASCSPITAVSADATVVVGDEIIWSITTDCDYQWQVLNETVWENIEGMTTNAYATGTSDINKTIRLCVAYDGENYYSPAVMVISNTPTYYITIPESITPSSANGYFDITGNRSSFTLTQSITVKCSGDFTLKLTSLPSITLGYTLYQDATRNIPFAKDGTGTVATFTGSGINMVPIYYTIAQPLYSGTYEDTLTFTITFNDG